MDSNLLNKSEVDIIGPDQIYGQTREFIEGSDPRTLDATVYSKIYDQALPWFKNARSVVYNMGNMPFNSPGSFSNLGVGDPESQYRQHLSDIDKLNKYGVETYKYSHPLLNQNIHSKVYTAEFQGQREAFISTGNLTDTGLNISPEKTQINFAYRISDPSIVSQIERYQAQIRNGIRAPLGSENLLVGGEVTQQLSKSIGKLSSGSQLYIAAAYFDEPRMAQSIIKARKRGVNVTVVADKGGSAVFNRKRINRTLEENGVKILIPEKDSQLKMHAKSVAAVSKVHGESFIAGGSSNLTGASLEARTLDVMLYIENQGLAKEMYSKLSKMETQYAGKFVPFSKSKNPITRDNPTATPMSLVELSMNARGLRGLYRRSVKEVTLDDYRKAQIERRNSGEFRLEDQELGTMPYYPTSLPAHYFSAFRGRTIPKLDIYQGLHKSRLGLTERDVLKGWDQAVLSALDRALETPSYGEQLNRIFNSDIIHKDYGVVGSVAKNIGRFFDFVSGSHTYQRLEKERAGYNEGSIRKLHQSQFKDDKYEGGFEKMFSSVYSMMSGTAIAAGTYLGISLPIQHIMADLTSKSIEQTIFQRQTGTNPILRGVRKNFRSLFFGAGPGQSINEVLEKPGAVEYEPDGFETGDGVKQNKYRIKDPSVANEIYNALESHNKGVQIEQNNSNELEVKKRKYGELGLQRLISGFRRYDQATFDTILRPIFEAISPYNLQDTDQDSPGYKYRTSLDSLSDIIGASPTIRFKKQGQSTHSVVLENIGRKRVMHIAKAWDRLGALIPANIAYWHPAVRRALKLPEFDPRENLTIRDFISFEKANKWVTAYVSLAGDYLKDLPGTINKASVLWRKEMNIRRKESQLRQQLRRDFKEFHTTNAAEIEDAVKRAQARKRANPGTDLAELADELQALEIRKTESFLDVVRRVVGEGQSGVQEYRQLILEQDTYIREHFYEVSRVAESTSDVQHPFGDKYDKAQIPKLKARLRSVQRFMAGIGGALLLDKILDDYLQNQGATFFESLAAHSVLNTSEGKTVNNKVSATLPVWMQALASAGLGYGLGFAFPNFSDTMGELAKPTSTAKVIAQGQRNMTQQFSEGFRDIDENIQAHRQADLFYETRSKTQDEIRLHRKRVKRTRTKFNTKLAAVGFMVGHVAIKGIMAGAAAAANWWVGNRRPTLEPEPIFALIAAKAEQALPTYEQLEAFSGEEIAMAMTVKMFAGMSISSSRFGGRTYNVAHQFTSPYLQVALVNRKTREGATTTGVGFQLMPILGMGVSPILPIGLHDRDEYYYGPTSRYTIGEEIFRIATLSKLGYMPESNFEYLSGLVGASTFVTLATRRLVKTLIPSGETTGAYESLMKTRGRIASIYKPILPFLKSALDIQNSVGRGILSLPFVAAESVFEGVASFFDSESYSLTFSKEEDFVRVKTDPDLVQKPKSYLSTKTPASVKNMLRRAAPYYLALVGTRILSEYYRDQNSNTGYDFDSASYRMTATLATGLTLGAALDNLGVFASSKEIYNYLERGQNYTGRRFAVVSKSLLRDMSSPYKELVDHQEELRKIENLKAQADFDSKSNIVTPTKPRSMKFRSIGARIALTAMILGGAKLTASAIAHILPEVMSAFGGSDPDKNLENLYKLPFAGPVLRLLAGVETTSSKDAGIQNSQRRDGVMGFLRQAAGMVFGPDLVSRTFYKDTPDPFFGLPFGGLSFKEQGIGYYIQFASTSSDLSMSAFDMNIVLKTASRSNMLQWRSLLTDAPTTSEAFYHRIRGSQPRMSGAKVIEALTSYEREFLSSTSLNRTLRIRNLQLANFGQQSKENQTVDYLKDAYLYGLVGDVGIPRGRLFSLYNPFNILSGGFGLTQGFDKSKNSATRSMEVAAEEAIIQRLKSSAFGAETIVEKFKPWKSLGARDQFTGKNDFLSNLMVTVPWVAATVGAAMSTYYALGLLSFNLSRSEAARVYEQSAILNTQRLFRSNAYRYNIINEKGQYRAYQFFGPNSNIDVAYRVQGPIHELITELEENARVNPADTFNLDKAASDLKYAHKGLMDELNSFFTGTSKTTQFRSILDRYVSGKIDAKEFKTQFQHHLKTKLKARLKQNVLNTRHTVYDLFYSDAPDRVGASFADEFIETQLQHYVDEMTKAVTDFENVLTLDKNKRILYLTQRLEESHAMKAFIAHIERPNPGAVVAEEAIYVSEQARTDARKYARKAIKTPYLEGALTDTFRGLKAVSRGAFWWAFIGRSAYELIESGALMVGQDKPDLLRRHASQLFVRSAIETTEAALIAGVLFKLTSVGLLSGGLLPSVLLFGGAALGLNALKQVNNKAGLRAEQAVVQTLGDFFFDPVGSTASLAEDMKLAALGNVIRVVGDPLGRVGGGSLSLISTPFRAIADHITGPVISHKTQILRAKGSLGEQMFWDFILPRSAYTEYLVSGGGRRTFQGNEPWVYGNPKDYFIRKQEQDIRDATRLDNPISPELVNPEILGRSSGFKQRQQYDRYFKSYAKNRIFGQFKNNSGYLSNSLRRELARRQTMMDLTVTGSPTSRMSDKPSNEGTFGILGVTRFLSFWGQDSAGSDVVREITRTGEAISDTTSNVFFKIRKYSQLLEDFPGVEQTRNLARQIQYMSQTRYARNLIWGHFGDIAELYNQRENVVGRKLIKRKIKHKLINPVVRTTRAALEFIRNEVVPVVYPVLDFVIGGPLRVSAEFVSGVAKAFPFLGRIGLAALIIPLAGAYGAGWLMGKSLKLAAKITQMLTPKFIREPLAKFGSFLLKKSFAIADKLIFGRLNNQLVARGAIPSLSTGSHAKSLATYLYVAGTSFGERLERMLGGSGRSMVDREERAIAKRLANKGNVPVAKFNSLQNMVQNYNEQLKAAKALGQEELTEEIQRRLVNKTGAARIVDYEAVLYNQKVVERFARRYGYGTIATIGLTRMFRPFTRRIINKKTAGFVTRSLFGIADVYMSYTADQKLEQLTRKHHSGFYASAHADIWASTSASYASALAASIKLNPLAGLGFTLAAAIAGGGFGYTRMGDAAYKNRSDFADRNKYDPWLVSLFSALAGAGVQVPAALNLLKQGKIGGALTRLVVPMVVGAAGGASGLGLATNAVGQAYTSFALDKISRYEKLQFLKTSFKSGSLLSKAKRTLIPIKGLVGRTAWGTRLIQKANEKAQEKAAAGGLRIVKVPDGSGKLARVLKFGAKALSVAGRVLQAGTAAFEFYRIFDANKKLNEARTAKELQVAMKQQVESHFGILTMAIGAPMGILGALGTGLIGYGMSGMYSNRLTKRAIKNRSDIQDIKAGQSIGTATGGLLAGALYTIGAALAIGSGPVSIPAVALGGLAVTAVGGLIGFISGSEYTTRDKSNKKSNDKKKKKLKSRATPINRRFSARRQQQMAQNSLLVAQGIGSDSWVMTPAEFEKELEYQKRMVQEFHGQTPEPQEDALDQHMQIEEKLNPGYMDTPWWQKVQGFMSRGWSYGQEFGSGLFGGFKQGLRKASGFLKSAYGTGMSIYQRVRKQVSATANAIPGFTQRTLEALGSYGKSLRNAIFQRNQKAEAAAAEMSFDVGQSVVFNPVYRASNATYLSERDFFNLIMMSMYEAGGTQNQLDAAISIMNRQAHNQPGRFYANDNSITELVFGEDQYEPSWKYNLTRANNLEDVIRQYTRDKGVSRDAAISQINQLTAALADPARVRESQIWLDGRYDFLGHGNKEQPNVRPYSPKYRSLTDPGANVFLKAGDLPYTVFDHKSISSDKQVYEKYLKQAKEAAAGVLYSGNAPGLAGMIVSRKNRPRLIRSTGAGEVEISITKPIRSLKELLPHHSDRSSRMAANPNADSWDFNFGWGEPAHAPLYAPRAFRVWSPEKAPSYVRRAYGTDVVMQDVRTGALMHIIHNSSLPKHVLDAMDTGKILPGGMIVAYQGKVGMGKDSYHFDVQSSTDEYLIATINANVTGMFGDVDLSKANFMPQNKPKARNSIPVTSSSKTSTSYKYGHPEYITATNSQLVGTGEYDAAGEILLQRDAAKAWTRMEAAAKAQGIDLNLASGFRSPADQEKLWRNAIQRYGSEEAAAKKVAPPKHSQHGTGLAIDIWQAGYEGSDYITGMRFSETPAYSWLKANAPSYGFELSFPEQGSQGAGHEPWHWMFVGTEAARREANKAKSAPPSTTKKSNLQSSNPTQDPSRALVANNIKPFNPVLNNVVPLAYKPEHLSVSTTSEAPLSSLSASHSSIYYPNQSVALLEKSIMQPSAPPIMTDVISPEEERGTIQHIFTASMVAEYINDPYLNSESDVEFKKRLEQERLAAEEYVAVKNSEAKAKTQIVVQVDTFAQQDNRRIDTAIRSANNSEVTATVRSDNNKLIIDLDTIKPAAYHATGFEEPNEFMLMDPALT